MKLNWICEGHWQVAPIKYPNSLAKPGKGRMSPLLHPEDREKFMKWTKGKRGKKK